MLETGGAMEAPLAGLSSSAGGGALLGSTGKGSDEKVEGGGGRLSRRAE